MKITDIRMKTASFQLKEPLHVAFGTISSYDSLVLRIQTDEGITGYGEAGPHEQITGESIGTCLACGQILTEALLGKDPLAIADIHLAMDRAISRNTSIKAAIDIACYDIAAKRAGLPLYRYLGGSDPHVTSDITIAMNSPEKMAADCVKWVQRGFTQLKLKLSGDPQLDLARVTAVRTAVGDAIELRVDPNQGWTVKETLCLEEAMRPLGVAVIEQPVKADDRAGLARVTRASHIPVVADESCHLPADALDLARREACDGVNIKLMKCGGIYNALRINAIAEAAGMFCMIGCMGESVIGNGASMHLAAACRNIQKADLDITFLTEIPEDGWIRGGFTHEGGACTLTEAPGIGIEVLDF
ncbi:MAG: dipeptide epimerase [Oscillospiraceae bacterium]|nr:dipeptide epimerase [Oscillospiraceae bacterium]